ncbi:ribose 1,5-bisphosphokinase [Psychromonas antarctica]|uniref:ribose 1,5-bisphosphokinase n=1 Tax=Psychromonas antarctica TaxID=67573 RepID=UPI001EE98E51|nr:ribose 1,5-bisphosphokinase [Psychromonas antarctica]MCG6202525.1 ribose 1,5-bisphosphokinase [Psychromonas antarctica]
MTGTLMQLSTLPSTGRLFYLIGPSGSGKDSIIEGLRVAINTQQPLLVASRYITRPADCGGEKHIALSVAEFRLRKQRRLFALEWHANGYDYGIGLEIIRWLDLGYNVLVNGSREYLPMATHRFPEKLNSIVIDVDDNTLATRLRLRGRECERDIQQRLARARLLQANLPKDCWHLDNNGELQHSIKRVLEYIEQVSRPSSSIK